MGKFMLRVLLVVAIAGCGGMPVKSDTPMANFHHLIVRNINWNETAVSELTGEEMKEFIASQPRLAELFRAVFEQYVKELGFFDTITFGEAGADADTLILEPKIYTLKPGGFMPGASYTGLLKTLDGKMVARYTAERRVSGTGKMGNIEKLVRELAEDAAYRLPYAR